MRFIFQLLLGMIFFNAMLIIMGGYFPSHHIATGVDVVNVTNISQYQNVGNILSNILPTFFLNFIGSFFVTLFVARLVTGGNLPTAQLLGACLVISLFIGLWNGLTTPLVGIAGSFPTIFPFYTIFTIGLGVVVMISVVEIFTGKGSEDG